MDLASRHYEAQGFDVEDTHARFPFDLRCKRQGLDVRVEVQGTRGDGESVEVSCGEVRSARGSEYRSDLFVVSGISVAEAEGRIVAGGGRAFVVEGWKPEESDLAPQTYRCRVPQERRSLLTR